MNSKGKKQRERTKEQRRAEAMKRADVKAVAMVMEGSNGMRKDEGRAERSGRKVEMMRKGRKGRGDVAGLQGRGFWVKGKATRNPLMSV